MLVFTQTLLAKHATLVIAHAQHAQVLILTIALLVLTHLWSNRAEHAKLSATMAITPILTTFVKHVIQLVPLVLLSTQQLVVLAIQVSICNG